MPVAEKIICQSDDQITLKSKDSRSTMMVHGQDIVILIFWCRSVSEFLVWSGHPYK